LTPLKYYERTQRYVFFFKTHTYLREKHANISINNHLFEPKWQIPVGIRAIVENPAIRVYQKSTSYLLRKSSKRNPAIPLSGTALRAAKNK